MLILLRLTILNVNALIYCNLYCITLVAFPIFICDLLL